jgi:hypothetical protein
MSGESGKDEMGATDPVAGMKAWQTVQANKGKARSGRTVILVVAILALLGGIVFYFLGSSNVETEITKVENQIAAFTPEQRAAFDANIQSQSGMSWEEAKASDRGAVRLQLATNVGLSLLYFGLWIWAKKNTLGAAMVALSVYVTVVVGSAIFDPKTIAQGIIMKIIIVSALVSAISSEFKVRRLGAPAS